MLVVSVTEGAPEVVLLPNLFRPVSISFTTTSPNFQANTHLFPGLPPGYSRGPLGTLIFSLIVVLLLLALLFPPKLGLRSGASLVAEAGREGLRNCWSSGTGSVRWNLRRGRDSAVGLSQCQYNGALVNSPAMMWVFG